MGRLGMRWAPVLALLLGGSPAEATPAADAGAYVEAIRKVNEEHARRPGNTREEQLAARLPAAARQALGRLLEAKEAPDLPDALVDCGEAALDLDLESDFTAIRARLEKTAPERAAGLGRALFRPRYLLRGQGDLAPDYLEKFGVVLDAVLDAYDAVFGFEEMSKVPGKKLRVRVRLVEKITSPPHFAPEHPYHSEVEFPVENPNELRSPTQDGKFLFYGLCHELGHVIAMWGDEKLEEDCHAWAHYTGVAIVEHLSLSAEHEPWMAALRDQGWRSLELERARLKKQNILPGKKTRDAVLSLFVALHDAVGPREIGRAINRLDREDRRLRIQRVRYYRLAELKKALMDGLADPAKRRAVADLIP